MTQSYWLNVTVLYVSSVHDFLKTSVLKMRLPSSGCLTHINIMYIRYISLLKLLIFSELISTVYIKLTNINVFSLDSLYWFESVFCVMVMGFVERLFSLIFLSPMHLVIHFFNNCYPPSCSWMFQLSVDNCAVIATVNTIEATTHLMIL